MKERKGRERETKGETGLLDWVEGTSFKLMYVREAAAFGWVALIRSRFARTLARVCFLPEHFDIWRIPFCYWAHTMTGQGMAECRQWNGELQQKTWQEGEKWKIDVVGRHPNCRCRPDRRGGRKRKMGSGLSALTRREKLWRKAGRKGRAANRRSSLEIKMKMCPRGTVARTFAEGEVIFPSAHSFAQQTSIDFFKITFSFNLLKCQLGKHDVVRL